MRLNGGCATCIGNVREINQDTIVFRSFGCGGHYFAILAVCDGIGGLEHGEIASAMLKEGINQWFDGIVRWLDVRTVEEEILYAHLKDAAEDWNQTVYEHQRENGIRMGTTMSFLMIVRDRYFILQVGDSRVYRYRNAELLQLTEDDSVSRMKNGKMKLYLNNYMGKADELWFSSVSGTVEAGDFFFVCSDGLYHKMHLEDAREACREVCQGQTIEAVCQKLIDKMMKRGESDNISVGIIAAEEKRDRAGLWRKW